jgi:hypothetical protein
MVIINILLATYANLLLYVHNYAVNISVDIFWRWNYKYLYTY